MDFYIDLAVTVMLRLLSNKAESNKYRRAILKIFRAIALQFSSDQEFVTVAQAHFPRLK